MQEGSIVEYIGGLEKEDIEYLNLCGIPIPQKGTPYLVEEIFMGQFQGGCGMRYTSTAVRIDLTNRIAFCSKMFKELLPPENINIEEILQVPQELELV